MFAKAAFVCAFALVACAFASDDADIKRQFIQFAEKFNKNYKSAEEVQYRLSVFNQTLARIARLNEQGGATFGVNKFSDLTPAEFKAKYLMSNYTSVRHEDVEVARSNVKAPAAFDWRTKNAVSPVKNQEQCGSCWAFSATESIESVWFLAGNSMVELAPQQIVDCDTTDDGCNGGHTESAFAYVIQAGGQEDENDYPYQGEDGTCNFNSADVKASITKWQYATQNNDETLLQNNLASMSPFSICVDAEPWQDYQSGVLMASQCGDEVDHCVQLVGYDTTAKVPYWIVRNSWDVTWGIEGYIWLQMGQNTCAMAGDVTVPTAGTPSTTTSSSGPTGSIDNEDEEQQGGEMDKSFKPSAAFLAA